jgi:integrase
MTVAGGTVRKRTWIHAGRKRFSWGWTIGKDQIRRQGFASREEAQADLDAYRAQIASATAPVDTAPGMTFGEAVERYLKVKARRKSLSKYEGTGRLLVAEFGAETRLADLTASRISEYRERRLTVRHHGQPLSPAAINRPLAFLRGLLRLAAREWEVIPTAPYIRTEKERQGRLRWLSVEEATRLLDGCRQSRNAALLDLVELALFTGMRQGELLGLTWDRVDRARGVILLEETKSGRRREVPLNGPADAALARRWRPGATRLVFPSGDWDSFRSAWERAVKVSKVTDFTFHDLRHTFASWCVQRGTTLPELKDLLGHGTLSMVLRYAHLAPENLRSAVSRLDGMLPTYDAHNAPTSAVAGGSEGARVVRNISS